MDERPPHDPLFCPLCGGRGVYRAQDLEVSCCNKPDQYDVYNFRQWALLWVQRMKTTLSPYPACNVTARDVLIPSKLRYVSYKSLPSLQVAITIFRQIFMPKYANTVCRTDIKRSHLNSILKSDNILNAKLVPMSTKLRVMNTNAGSKSFKTTKSRTATANTRPITFKTTRSKATTSRYKTFRHHSYNKRRNNHQYYRNTHL